jgi:hypothetical protein
MGRWWDTRFASQREQYLSRGKVGFDDTVERWLGVARARTASV